MTKTIEKAIKDGWNICDKAADMGSFDFYNTGFLNGVAHLRSLPLRDRLTEAEKERVLEEYAKTRPDDLDRSIADIVFAQSLRSIFGKEMFEKEGE